MQLCFMFLNFSLVCQNISVCLNLDRPRLAIVYCYDREILKHPRYLACNIKSLVNKPILYDRKVFIFMQQTALFEIKQCINSTMLDRREKNSSSSICWVSCQPRKSLELLTPCPSHGAKLHICICAVYA